MSDKPDTTQVAWEAFPAGWFDEPGTLSRCGARLARFPRGSVWVLPPMDGNAARLAPADAHSADPDITRLRAALSLLPDASDPATAAMLRDLLARRAGLDPSRGVTWTPRAEGKNHGGWTLSTPTQSKVLPASFVPERDPETSLFRAIAVTNCTCQTNPAHRDRCPQHGERVYKPWR
ncbi:MAG: hypothetical protein EBT79_12690 [Actinobacteria bacterium]|nr:hypothetical protein [Actinomycetota bacterium]NBR68102.1 hypothetical protein [Actinomycetota bacterium]